MTSLLNADSLPRRDNTLSNNSLSSSDVPYIARQTNGDQEALTSPSKPTRTSWRCLLMCVVLTIILLIGLTVALFLYREEVNTSFLEVDSQEGTENHPAEESEPPPGYAGPQQKARKPQTVTITDVRLGDRVGDAGRLEVSDGSAWFTICNNDIWIKDNDGKYGANIFCKHVLNDQSATGSSGATNDPANLNVLQANCDINDCEIIRLNGGNRCSDQRVRLSCLPDNINPVIETCPSNQPEASDTITASLGGSTSYTFSPATATDKYGDNSDAPTPTITYSIGAPSPIQTGLGSPTGVFAIGTSTVTATATDNSGNTAECMFTVTVIEGDPPPPPDITCPSNQPEGADTITAPPGETTSYTFPPATTTDAPAPTITYSIGAPSPIQTGLGSPTGVFAIGTSTVTVTATDSSGNTAECMFTVTVIEGDPPPPPLQTPWNENGAFSDSWKTLNEICGRAATRSGTRIIGGQPIGIEYWPWATPLFTVRRGRLSYTCMAEIITSRYVLTAAHCVDRKQYIRVGSTFRNEGTLHEIQGFLRHPDYNPYTLDNDIALLQLATPVVFSDSVKPVCPTFGVEGPVADREYITYQDQDCYVVGWGNTDADRLSLANHLQEVFSPLLPQCTGPGLGYTPEDITGNMICTSTEDNTGSCQGDSGGPMMCWNPAGWWDLVGVTSWGYGCADSLYPDVNTRVSQYMYSNWIQDIIDLNEGP